MGAISNNWRALVAFQQLIILSDADGVVDMTPESIARRTNIPLDIIEDGLRLLEEPDPQSRPPSEDGRRIVRLDKNRDWGWQLVNHGYYRNLASREAKKAADRDRIAANRAGGKDKNG